MSRIEWSKAGERFFETGIGNGVLYTKGAAGVPWNGLVSVEEAPTGGDVEGFYFNGVKYLDIVASEDFSATLTAYAAPPSFAACEGERMLARGLYVTQQPRTTFGLCYRTLLGNDLEGTDYGYKLHLVWNCTAQPSNRSYKTLSRDASPDTRSWTLQSVPPYASDYKPTAHITIDSTQADPERLAAVESLLYGSDGLNPRLPDQVTVIQAFS